MIGGNLEARPEDYIARQHYVNLRHTNGSIEVSSDYERVYDLIEDLELEALPPGSSILSLGCRTGYEVRILGQRFPNCRVVGLDIVGAFIVAAEVADGNPNTEYYNADMHQLPFRDGEFDVVFCVGTFEHCYNLQRAALEMQRVCKRLLYVTADLMPDVSRSDEAASEDPAEWLSLFQREGWKLKRDWQEPGCIVKASYHMVWERT